MAEKPAISAVREAGAGEADIRILGTEAWVWKTAETGQVIRAGSQLLLDEAAERAQRGLDLVGPRYTAAHPQAVPVTILHRKEVSRGRVDAALERGLAQPERVHLGREFDPDEIA